MKTVAVGLRTFRKDLSRYIVRLQSGREKFIVLRHNVPVMEVRPLLEPEAILDNLIEEISEARRQIASGDTFSFIHVCTLFGYDPKTLRCYLFKKRP